MNDIVQNRSIFLFQINADTRKKVGELISRGYLIDGIVCVDSNKIKLKSVWGIPIIDLNKIYELRRTSILLIFEYDHVIFKQYLNAHGYFENYNLYVLKTSVFVMDNSRLSRYSPLLSNFCKAINGLCLVKKIKRTYGELPIIVYEYTGLGDLYVIFGVIDNSCRHIFILEKRNLSNLVEQAGDIAVVFTKKQIECLYYYCNLTMNKDCIQFITPWDMKSAYKTVSNNLYGYKLSMLNIYNYFVGNSVDAKLKRVRYDVEMDIEIEKKKWSDSILLIPYANSLVTFPLFFWEKLAFELKKRGYQVYTNVNEKEIEIKGTHRLECSISYLIKVVKYLAGVVAIRNGLCDWISGSETSKVILYPNMEKENFGGYIYNAFSINRMGYGVKLHEISWCYSDYDKLVDKICSVL